MIRRGVLPVIALAIVSLAGCARETVPTNVVRSSTPLAATTLPPLSTPATRRFKETLLFVPHAADVRRVVEALDPREVPSTYILPGAHGEAMIDLRFPSSPIELALTPSASTLLFGDEGSLEVALTDEGVRIDDATLEVTLVSPKDHARRALTTTSHTLNLRTAFRRDDAPGVWTIEVRAKGTSRSVAFDRFGTVAVRFAFPTARLRAAAAPRTNEDGSIDLDVALDVVARDRLQITAVLVGAGDRPIARADTTATFELGASTATLHVEGAQIAASGVLGPYAFRNLRLFSIGTGAPLGALALDQGRIW